MKSTVKKLPNSEVELEIEIPSEEFNKFVEQASIDAGKDLEVQGFRKGKAPKEIIEKEKGRENILIEAADRAIKENYRKFILENNIEAISEPKIDILKLALGNPLIFKAKVSVLPEIELPNYREIVKKSKGKERLKKISVEEQEINNALKWLQKSRAKLTLKNEPAEKGDFIEIEYSSPQIKELGEKGDKKDTFIIGEGHFIPGFEDKLIGLKANQEKEFSLDIPQDFSFKQIAGQKIDFKVKVSSVQNLELPELDDQFAKGLGNFDNLEALKENIRKGLTLEKEQAESQRIRNEALEKIGQALKFEIPQFLIKREQEAMIENFKQEVSEKLKIPLKDYLAKIKKTEQEVSDSFKAEAEKRVKNFLILKEIGQKEKIEVSDEEVRNRANEILQHIKKTEKDLDFKRLKEYSREVIKNEKIFKLLESLVS